LKRTCPSSKGKGKTKLWPTAGGKKKKKKGKTLFSKEKKKRGIDGVSDKEGGKKAGGKKTCGHTEGEERKKGKKPPN